MRLMEIAAPIVTLIAAVVVGAKLGAFDQSLTAAVTSPLTGALILGLSLFPAGSYLIVRGLLSWVRTRQSKYWPTISAHVIENEPHPYYGTGGPFVRFWYVVNGRRYDKYSVQFRSYPVGTDIEVHFDPEEPAIAIIKTGDAAPRFYIWGGLVFFMLPFVISWPLVWLSN